MIRQDPLARLTLDTLPFNIAVLDDDGTIRFTNRSWRDFAGAEAWDDRNRDSMVGTNYFESMDVSTDEYAVQALAGLQAVIEGEREVFTLEYPCHSADEKHWFLMRAAALPDHERGSVAVAHIDITQRKLAEIRARDQRRELEYLMSLIDGLIQNVMEAVLQASTREEIEETVCRRLVEVDPYVSAWVGHVDLRTDALTPATTAGVTAAGETDIALDGDDPAARAVSTGKPQVTEVTAGTSLSSAHSEPGDETRASALAALPLAYNDTSYGALTVAADHENAFHERELAVLCVLARTASTAINAIEGRRLLTTDRIVEMEVSLFDEELFFSEMAAELDGRLAYQGSLYEDDGSVVMLFVVEGVDPETVVSMAEAHDSVGRVMHVSDGDEQSVFQFVVEAPPVVSELAERGAETTAITATGRSVSITLELPASADPRSVIEQLSEPYPSTELVARREREPSAQTRRELVTDIQESLTTRQELALRKAYLGGFFEWPRTVSGEELAESMDISPSTYHQHLRTAEQKLLAALFDG
jgi:PAS domain S-box-containing protein